jgi:hypothetical protein
VAVKPLLISVIFLRTFVCTESGYHSYEDVEKVAIISVKILVKYGYKSNMKNKSLIIFPYFGYTLKTKYKNLVIFPTFFSLLATGKLQNHLIFYIFSYFAL